MTGSSGRKTVSVMRGMIMLCETCYGHVVAEKLVDQRNFVENYQEMFDTICLGCEDLNRPLIDDMLGSSE
jgi:hypothetical protein